MCVCVCALGKMQYLFNTFRSAPGWYIALFFPLAQCCSISVVLACDTGLVGLSLICQCIAVSYVAYVRLLYLVELHRY